MGEFGMYLDFTDEALMNLISNGESKALEALFNRHYKSLCQFCVVYTKDYEAAEEIIADLFIKIWDGRLGEPILNVKAYLFAAARNLSLNHLQKKKAPVTSIEELPETHLFQDLNTPFRILSGRESSTEILRLIDRLPDRQREILLMSRIDQMDKHKIAAVLAISVRTVETTLYQSLRELRRMLNDSPNVNLGH